MQIMEFADAVVGALVAEHGYIPPAMQKTIKGQAISLYYCAPELYSQLTQEQIGELASGPCDEMWPDELKGVVKTHRHLVRLITEVANAL